jgi:propionate CoA-transferase
MRYGKIIPTEDAVALIQDADVVASSGYGGNGTPEALLAAIEQRFLASGTPRNLTLVWAGGQGVGPPQMTVYAGKHGSVLRPP